MDGKSNSAELIAHCSHCHRGVMFHLKHNGNGPFAQPKDLAGDILPNHWSVLKQFPESPSTEAPPHTPDKVASALSDALRSRVARIWQGAGMLARKAIEMALAEKKGLNEIPNLKKAIQELRKSGEVPAYVADWGEHVTALGNDAAHRPEFNEKEAKEAIEFAEELIKSLFTRPQQIALVRKQYEEKSSEETGPSN
ncbi:DUF4145 domain-containing protein [Nisaea denitrificans]|uniref:DUF4145 domain-containing protein n=1 Tax=Nisaea denitrificans TaxID=390877 RepID=UPI00146F9BA6|nr:DUF4145 domain-containing protein [Nisaea denitrificans]